MDSIGDFQENTAATCWGDMRCVIHDTRSEHPIFHISYPVSHIPPTIRPHHIIKHSDAEEQVLSADALIVTVDQITILRKISINKQRVEAEGGNILAAKET